MPPTASAPVSGVGVGGLRLSAASTHPTRITDSNPLAQIVLLGLPLRDPAEHFEFLLPSQSPPGSGFHRGDIPRHPANLAIASNQGTLRLPPANLFHQARRCTRRSCGPIRCRAGRDTTRGKRFRRTLLAREFSGRPHRLPDGLRVDLRPQQATFEAGVEEPRRRGDAFADPVLCRRPSRCRPIRSRMDPATVVTLRQTGHALPAWNSSPEHLLARLEVGRDEFGRRPPIFRDGSALSGGP